MFDLESLKSSVTGIDFYPKRPDIYKILVPFFYEDGDMYDIFLEKSPVNPNMLRLTDHGLTIMKLSYTFDINTDTKKNVLNSIVSQNRASIEDGEIFVDIKPGMFQQYLYQMAQTLAKVSNIDILSKEWVKTMFYDMLKEFIVSSFSNFNVTERYAPLYGDEDLLVDYKIDAQRPIFLYGVKDDTKASKVIINCLNFQKTNIPFRSLIVHENFEELSSFNKKQITNTADKQFWLFEDFKKDGAAYINRELLAA